MNDFIDFLRRLAAHMGLTLADELVSPNEAGQCAMAANILAEINRFFFQRISTVPQGYVSQFHVFWEKYHERVLDPKVDIPSCLKVARVLESIYRENEVRVQLDPLDLSKEQVAQVRFFTAIQDFKLDIGKKGNPFEIYKRKPECFEPARLLKNELLVDTFLTLIGVESQRDKRKDWMLKSAQFLLTDYDGCAYAICQKHHGDAQAIRHALTVTEGYGFSKKKADMLLRDLADLAVWRYRSNADTIDVMSDANTMRIALRTGILRFRIPLLASYLDVYCYQYELADRKNTEAWRQVWIEWAKIAGNHRPPTPASVDYLIYRMGKLSCKRSSRKCPPEAPANRKKIESLLAQDQLLYDNEGYCIFKEICPMERKPLQPPKSISILGQTGWQSGLTNEGGGGGISS
jgi:hypothetical protein